MTKEQLLQLSNKFLLGGAKVHRSVYQSLIAEYEKIEKAQKTPDFINILQKKIKEKEESITYATAANRDDLLNKEQLERDILVSLLPEQLTDEEVVELITDVKKKYSYNSAKDIRGALTEVILLVAGRYDSTKLGSLTSKIILNGN